MAAWAIGRIGPSAAEATQELINNLSYEVPSGNIHPRQIGRRCEPALPGYGPQIFSAENRTTHPIERIGPRAVPYLLNGLTDLRPGIRWHCLELLDRLHVVESQATISIQSMSSDENTEVRVKAARTLWRTLENSEEYVDSILDGSLGPGSWCSTPFNRRRVSYAAYEFLLDLDDRELQKCLEVVVKTDDLQRAGLARSWLDAVSPGAFLYEMTRTRRR